MSSTQKSTNAIAFDDKTLDVILVTRDSHQRLIDKIDRDVKDQHKFAAQRLAGWRLSIGSTSFAIALAIIPLILFGEGSPKYPTTIVVGILCVLINGFISYFLEKRDIEVDLNAVAYLGKEEKLTLMSFIHTLNKAHILRSQTQMRQYARKSALYAKEQSALLTTQVDNKKARINIWSEINTILPMLAGYLFLRELLGQYRIAYWSILCILIIGSIIYIMLEYRHAKIQQQKGLELEKKITQKRKKYDDWWQRYSQAQND